MQIFKWIAEKRRFPHANRRRGKAIIRAEKYPNSRENGDFVPAASQENPVSPQFIFGNNSPTRENAETTKHFSHPKRDAPHNSRRKKRVAEQTVPLMRFDVQIGIRRRLCFSITTVVMLKHILR
jgi:hypothetical protein